MSRVPRSELRTETGWRSLDRLSLVIAVLLAAVLFWLWPGRLATDNPETPLVSAADNQLAQGRPTVTDQTNSNPPVNSGLESKPSHQPDPKLEGGSDPASSPKPVAGGAPQQTEDTESKPGSQPEPAPTPVSEPDSGTEPAAEAQPPAAAAEPDPAPQPEPDAKPLPASASEPTPALEPQPTPAPEPASKPEPVPEPQPAPAPAPEPKPTPAQEPASKPEPVPEPQPAPAPAPEPKPAPAQEPASKPEPVPEPQPAPAPAPEPKPAPAKDPVSKPEPATTSQPEPAQESRPQSASRLVSPSEPKVVSTPGVEPRLQPDQVAAAGSGDSDLPRAYCRALRAGRTLQLAFSASSARLSDAMREQLDAVTVCLKSRAGSFMVGGHTDNQGSSIDNLLLSVERARVVSAYLVSQGVRSSRLEYRGFGHTQPIGDNWTRTGRARNRRIEIKSR